MIRYTLWRLAQAVPTVLGVTLLAFLLLHAVPGDPGRIELGPHATQAQVAAFDRSLDLNKPIITQYIDFLSGAWHGNLGNSTVYHDSVATVIKQHAAPTLLVIAYAMIIALVIAIPSGIYVAERPDGAIDHGFRAVGMVLFAMPAFWLGILLVLGLGVAVPLFPVSGYGSGGFGSKIESLTLPALTLGLALAPLFVRTLRARLIDTLSAGFIEAAYARGFSRRRVLYRHALRPSSVSLLTIAGLTVASLISGTVVIETLFGLPGLGQLLVQSVTSRDFRLIQGLVLVLALAVVLINLITDLLYGVLDARVRVTRTN